MPTKPDSETVRHPLATAWDEWLASNEGQEARAANTLPHNTNHYLENRLHRAFDAGAKAATLSPSDFEQLLRLRKAAQATLPPLQYLVRHGHVPDDLISATNDVIAALREALAQRQGGES